MDDLKAHFKMGYAPNNCVMVVVGDVSADEVLKLAKEVSWSRFRDRILRRRFARWSRRRWASAG